MARGKMGQIPIFLPAMAREKWDRYLFSKRKIGISPYFPFSPYFPSVPIFPEEYRGPDTIKAIDIVGESYYP
jgi:hypothetical protein